jgi:3',5'-cyclic AMP phosphodiesterase CpdA
VLLQLTDLHLGRSRRADARTRGLIERVLDGARPDLVVLTGDILEGRRARNPGAALRYGLGPILERRLPWAPVLGNHDDEGRLGRRAVFALLRSLPGCLGRPGPARLSGVGNYVLRVAGRRPRGGANLFMLDSHSYAPPGLGSYAWIRADQIDWFRRSRADRRLPALVFFHIPLPEWDEAWRAGSDRRGRRGEAVSCPALNSGLFAAFVERGDVVGAFCGHDHGNDYAASLHGIRLAYGRATGYGGYAVAGAARGARIIELREGERGCDTRVVPGRAARGA